MKQYIYIITLALALILSGSSCSREQEQKPGQTQMQKTPPIPSVMTQTEVNPASVFSVQRTGQTAKIKIGIDFSGCHHIEISRNMTGVLDNSRYTIARLAPQTKQFKDVLPDAKGYYYWLSVYLPKGAYKRFGPIRTTEDVNNSGTYTQLSDSYHWSVSRTDMKAVIQWDFPNIKYQRIAIYRNTSSAQAKRSRIFSTMEWKSQTTDNLPDSESDYWYWIEAILENGAIVNMGPIKAEFQ